jgi:transcriptional regulator with XRE-family HTH domain
MTTTERQRRPRRTATRRPASGIAIEPAKLTYWRDRRELSRQELADKITALWLAGHPDALPFTHKDTLPAAEDHRPAPVIGQVPRACRACGRPVAGGITRDALAKFENGERRPKARTVRALRAALSGPDYEILPGDLMPGGPPLVLSPAAQDRAARLDFNAGMRELAVAIGRPELFRNASGRISYTRELRDMYLQYLTGAAGQPALAS